MRYFLFLFAILPASFPFKCCAQATAAPVADPYRNEAIVFEHFDTTIRMHADGTGDSTIHVTARIQSEGAARQFSVIAVPYAAAYETGSIEYISVHKSDGSTIETPTADAIEMPAQVTREAPLYSDLKEKQMPVRSLAAGDVIEYQMRTVRTRAEAPGQFWGAEHFLTEAGVVLSQTLMLEVPADTYVQVWAPNHPAIARINDGIRRYFWSTSQLKFTGKGKDDTAHAGASSVDKVPDPDEDAEGRKIPSVAWTTFHSWQEVGRWYRGLALSRSEPTSAIVTRANELTKDAKTPEDQVRALYEFVALHTRYVGIDFGVGRYQPHSAGDVMDHEYGDCKDKDTLLEALLRAKGFVTAPALIGVNLAPVADVPSPALFNHVITTVDLPSGRIWLDSTPEGEPYRVLIPLIRDEQALVIPAIGDAKLERTPADPPFAYFERFEATGSLDEDGLLKSHMVYTMRSDNELGFRILLQRAAPSQWDEAMQSISRAMGFAGTVSNADLKQKDAAGPVQLNYDYTRPAFADWDNHRILPLFPVLEIAYIDKDKAPEHDIDLGALRKLDAVTHIRLPEGFFPALPDAVHVKRDYTTFDKIYEVQNGELIVQRTVVVLKRKVPKSEWKDYYAFTKQAGAESGEDYISLVPSTKATSGMTVLQDCNVQSAGADGKARDASTQEASLAAMKKAARQLEISGDWDAARSMLNNMKCIDQNYPYLMSMLGYLAMHDGKTDEAIGDYETELAHHPDASSNIVTSLAYAYTKQKRYTDAEALLGKYLERNDTVLSTALAYTQTRSGDERAALSTLKDAMAGHPNDSAIETSLAAALHRAHRDEEAAKMAKAALLISSEPGVLNTNAYLLSQMKLQLPLAEQSSRHAIELLETASRKLSFAEANETAFAQSNLLAASWDTLGWIYFQEGRPADAESYIRAAWFNRPDVEVGNHLGQVLEALKRPLEALTIDQLTLVSDGVSDRAEVVAEVQLRIDRLSHGKPNLSTIDATKALQDQRTFHLSRPPDLKGSGTFRIALSDNRIETFDLVKGLPEMGEVSSEIQRLKLPYATPKDSQALVYHRAVLSCSSDRSTCEFVFTPH